MASNSHRHCEVFAKTLENVYHEFVELARSTHPRGELLLTREKSQFLGVATGLKTNFDYQCFRSSIASMFGLKDFRMIQIVGDSGSPFSANGIRRVTNIIETYLKHSEPGKETILEYGYTASLHDTNWIVNDIIASRPGIGHRTIANTVHMSAVAVQQWGCEATEHVEKFVLAYDTDRKTVFGDDMWLSDFVMDRTCGDILICVEGGPQAFVQAVNVCLRGIKVIAITGTDLRDHKPEDPSFRFSAARMLKTLVGVCRPTENRQTSIERRKVAMERSMEYLSQFSNLQTPADSAKYEMIQISLQSLLNNLEHLNTIVIVDI